MNAFAIFLETSTIHGLKYIATTKKYVRLFWILVICTGFSGAGYLIYQSFNAWDESPVKTTIETRSITELAFPKVTVCPPKNTYTDLNYDLMMAANITVDNETRNELASYALELLYDDLYSIIMANFSKLENNDRYFNWYQGYDKIELPYYDYNGVTYDVHTSATSGTISTQYFGDMFDADKVETYTKYYVYVVPPDSVKSDSNVTLHFKVQKISLGGLSTGKDKISLYYPPRKPSATEYIDAETTHFIKNFTPPLTPDFWGDKPDDIWMGHERKVIQQDVRKQKLKTMPGFRLIWYYSPFKVLPSANYKREKVTKAFIRNYSNISICFICFVYLFHSLYSIQSYIFHWNNC